MIFLSVTLAVMLTVYYHHQSYSTTVYHAFFDAAKNIMWCRHVYCGNELYAFLFFTKHWPVAWTYTVLGLLWRHPCICIFTGRARHLVSAVDDERFISLCVVWYGKSCCVQVEKFICEEVNPVLKPFTQLLSTAAELNLWSTDRLTLCSQKKHYSSSSRLRNKLGGMSDCFFLQAISQGWESLRTSM